MSFRVGNKHAIRKTNKICTLQSGQSHGLITGEVSSEETF